MPRVNDLNKKTSGGVFGDSKPAAPTTTAALTQSKQPTAAEQKALQKAASGVKIPEFLQKSTLPELASGELTGYVGFCDQRSKNFVQMTQAGIKPGETYICKDGKFTKAYPLEFFLCMGDSFRTTMEGQDGEFTFATRDLVTPLKQLADTTGNPSALKAEPHYAVLLIVNLNGSLIPIKADIRGTKAKAAEGPIRAMEAANSPEWLRLSNAHQATAAFPHPFGRVYNIVTTQYTTFKASGRSGFVAKSQSNPATVDQMQMLIDAMGDDDFNSTLEEARNNYNMRIDFLDKLVAGETAPATGS